VFTIFNIRDVCKRKATLGLFSVSLDFNFEPVTLERRIKTVNFQCNTDLRNIL